MYPYNDPVTGVPVPADPCFDSSPNFKEQPKTILCTGFPFSYNHNASDPELDNLVYDWAYPLMMIYLNGVFSIRSQSEQLAQTHQSLLSGPLHSKLILFLVLLN